MRKIMYVLVMVMALQVLTINVFAAEQNGLITDRTGTVVGFGHLEGNSESAEARTESNFENAAVTTRIRYASERDLGSWVGGGSVVSASSSGVSGVINMCESYHKVGNFDIGLILYF